MELSLTKLPWYGQIGAFLVLALAGIGAFGYYYEWPARGDLDLKRQQAAALQKDINMGTATAKKLPEFRAQVSELEARLNNLKAVLPEEKDAADLLRRMQGVAAQSNLTIKSFKPADPVTKTLHSEWPINLELEGTYHNLAIFFDRVSKFTRIVNISRLDVKGKESNGKADPNSTITASCVATTFVLLEQKPGGKGGAKGAAAKPPATKGT
jgi:Tfp pilus assembly protein PilO